MVSAASTHGKIDRRNHKAIIADRQAKEATVNGIPEGIVKRTGKPSRKYKKRGGKICKVKDAAAPATESASSSAASSSATAVGPDSSAPCPDG